MRHVRIKYRLCQMLLNAVALIAIGGGMAAYFKAYSIDLPNSTIFINTDDKLQITPLLAKNMSNGNPAPGICLPIIVSYCQHQVVPYNYTVFPNYMGNFGQRDAQEELENIYDVIVDVRCYELAALFLCSIFVPKCGQKGVIVRPCRNLCNETTRRCGFFLEVFGLSLPGYMDCNLFPDSQNPEDCVGHQEVENEQIRSKIVVCPSGFQCDINRCLPKDWHCDGHVDCEDQTDEMNCETCGADMIHCGSDKCITQEHMCDGVVQCPWAQDERNCVRLSERNGDEGRGQLELFRPDQQQWIPACMAHWDPDTSPHSICALLGYSNVNVTKLIRGREPLQTPPLEEITKWRIRQHMRHINMLRDFRACNGNSFPSVNIVCKNYACGKIRRTYAEQKQLRIVGGVAAKPGDWPFLAALLGGPEEIFYCAGVLIADQWVLTASHCVGNHSNITGWTIQLGITRRHAHSYYGQKMKVKRVVPHPLYNFGITHDNDIALFQLSSRVTYHEHLLPVCLPESNKVLHPGTYCTVIGWGKKEDIGSREYEPEINEVEVPVLSRSLCNTWLESRDLNVTDGMICAGYKEGGKDACQGDSGGPLLCRDERDPERWFVGGIVSWGIKCAHPHLPGVYAYVPKYTAWIQQQMRLYDD